MSELLPPLYLNLANEEEDEEGEEKSEEEEDEMDKEEVEEEKVEEKEDEKNGMGEKLLELNILCLICTLI